jgi:hypothetical protein
MLEFHENRTHFVPLALLALALEASPDLDALFGGIGIS